MNASKDIYTSNSVAAPENESMYTRALWEWTNKQLLQARRKSEEAHMRKTGYQPRRHKHHHDY
jgi:hypothetical protein